MTLEKVDTSLFEGKASSGPERSKPLKRVTAAACKDHPGQVVPCHIDAPLSGSAGSGASGRLGLGQGTAG